jgi:hypothetical protein
MKNIFFIFFILFLGSCGEKTAPAMPTPVGVYQGVTPCAECDAMLQTVYFYPQGRYVRVYEYLDRRAANIANRYWEIGKYQQEKDGKITATANGRDIYFNFSGKTLQMLNEEANAYTGENTEGYLLSKIGDF